MKMDEVEGIGPVYAEQLALAGIATADALLEQGAKPGAERRSRRRPGSAGR